MTVYLLLALTSMLLLGISFFMYFTEPETKQVIKYRKRQLQSILSETIRQNTLYEKINKTVKQSKKYKIETHYLQAGLAVEYPQHLLLSLGISFIVFFCMMIGTNSLLLSSLFTLLSYHLPLQIVIFLKNKRYDKLEDQIGPFMHMLLARYENSGNLGSALRDTEVDFIGEDPLYSEIKKTNTEILLGVPIQEALFNMARRTNNRFIERLSEYYGVTLTLGTEDAKKNILEQAYTQYKEFKDTKLLLKKELAAPKRDAYIMLSMIPGFFVYQVMTNKEYLHFMLGTTNGQLGMIVIGVIFFGSFWFINNKINAPIV